MLEVFFIQSGHAVMAVNGTDYPLTASSCIVVKRENHELRNTSPDEELVVTYFGVGSASTANRERP